MVEIRRIRPRRTAAERVRGFEADASATHRRVEITAGYTHLNRHVCRLDANLWAPLLNTAPNCQPVADVRIPRPGKAGVGVNYFDGVPPTSITWRMSRLHHLR